MRPWPRKYAPEIPWNFDVAKEREREGKKNIALMCTYECQTFAMNGSDEETTKEEYWKRVHRS